MPPFRSILRGRANLRNHRKMLVADGERLWCRRPQLRRRIFRGRSGERRRAPAWHDLSFDLRGELVAHACELFEHDWAYARAPPVAAPMPRAA